MFYFGVYTVELFRNWNPSLLKNVILESQPHIKVLLTLGTLKVIALFVYICDKAIWLAPFIWWNRISYKWVGVFCCHQEYGLLTYMVETH